MSKYDKVIEFVNQQYMMITSKNFLDNNISYYYINKLLKDDYIIESSKGIYYKSDGFEDEFYALQKRYKKAIFSYNIALYFMDKTEIIPSSLDITVPYGYHINIKDPLIRVHYCNKDIYDLGIITIKTPFGNEVKCYNLERTICDIVKKDSRTDIDIEQRNKILRYNIGKTTDWRLLDEYSKKLKIEKKLDRLTEVLY